VNFVYITVSRIINLLYSVYLLVKYLFGPAAASEVTKKCKFRREREAVL